MKQEEWNKRLRDHLADHQEPVNDELWTRIEASLPRQRQRKSRIIPIIRWAAAASLLAVTLGGGYVMWWGNNANEAPLATTHTEAKPSTVAQTAMSTVPAPMDIPDSPRLADILAPTSLAQTTPNIPDSLESLDTPASTSIAQTIPDIPDSSESTDMQAPTSFPQATPDIPDSPEKSSSFPLTINLYAANNVTQMNGRNPVAVGGEMAQAYYDAASSFNKSPSKRLSSIYLANYSESKKHYLPLSVGLSVSYPFTPKVSLSMGLVYTHLRSDFSYTIRGNQIQKQQRLQYLGIPLSIQYRWWTHHNLQVYLSLGGEADWNIKAQVKTANTTTDIDKDKCQWSLSGSLGLQYAVTPLFSFYAEPGVKHYLDNGSKIDNIFKDKPTQFNIELGIRLHLPNTIHK